MPMTNESFREVPRGSDIPAGEWTIKRKKMPGGPAQDPGGANLILSRSGDHADQKMPVRFMAQMLEDGTLHLAFYDKNPENGYNDDDEPTVYMLQRLPSDNNLNITHQISHTIPGAGTFTVQIKPFRHR